MNKKYCLPIQKRIETGYIEGLYETKTEVQRYAGIPYAKPPVGDLRWRNPQSVEKWSGVRDAKEFGPSPIQREIWGDISSRSGGLSEDCLYLNVWTNAKDHQKDLPVLVYFYGGGFLLGCSSELRYDGKAMAQDNIVVVTVNYRVNIFGFFAHPELSKESDTNSSGNYGFFDQNAALKWVKRNIHEFGGNPDKVTIAGESAGSMSVSAHMASPLSKGLFRAAIGQSGALFTPYVPNISLKGGELFGKNFMSFNGLSSLKELRQLPAYKLFDMVPKGDRPIMPMVLDGHFLVENLEVTFSNSRQSKVPLLLGWNSAELPPKDFYVDRKHNLDSFHIIIKEWFGEYFDEALKLYPHDNKTELNQSATDLITDKFMAYITWKWYRLHLDNSDENIYRYLFCKKSPLSKSLKLTGAHHATDIEYCLGNIYLSDDDNWTENDQKVSDVFKGYFVNFIKNCNPNGTDLPNWNGDDRDSKLADVMVIDNDSAMKKIDDSRFDLWQKGFRLQN